MLRNLLLVLLAVAFAPSAALAHSHKRGGLEIVHPWTPAMLEKSATTTQVFMKLKNRSGVADRLLSASTVVAAKVELRKGGGADDAMRPAAELPIKAGEDTELLRDGPHLVLIGVKKRLNAYDTFKLTLVFARAGRLVVDVVVEEAEAPAPHKH